MATTTAPTPPATRPGLSRSASVIVTSRRPSLRVKTTAREGAEGIAMEGGERGRKQTRPITFALPPPSADSKSPHLTSSLPSSSANPPPPPLSPTTPTSSSFLNRLTRKLSQSRSTLVRRVSIGKGTGGKPGPSSSSAASTRSSSSPPSPVITRAAEGEADKENAPPPTTGTGLTPPRASTSRPGMGKRSSSHTPSTSSALARAARQQAEAEQAPAQERTDGGATAGGAPLRRGLRVSVMRRTKSEAKRKGRILNEEGKMDELVRRTEEADAGGKAVQEGEGAAGRRGDWEEVHSSMGSYFWSDSLGVCWDGREKVHPDVLFSFQPYSSDSDVLPPHLQNQQNRIVYASTLSSFPPRPPLRPRTPEMTEAGKIIAEWRKVNGTMTPSVHGDEAGEGEEEGLETVVGSEQDTPRPVDGEDEPGPLAATPLEQEPEAALALKTSTNTVRTRPSFAALPVSSNPFASPSSSSTSPAVLAPSPQRRPLSPNSFFSAPSTSAYSTPTSEPGQFHFRSGSDGGEEGGEEEGAGEGGVRMSSEGSETSLESIAALAGADKGRA